MITIFKYPAVHATIIEIPEVHETLHVAFHQDQDLHMWLQVDTETPYKRVMVDIHGTSDEVEDPQNKRYVGTVFKGALVWHVYLNYKFEK